MTGETLSDKKLTKTRTLPPADVKAIRQNKQLRLDSMTGVDPKRTHGWGLWGNERVVFSVRVDKKLKKAFTEASKAIFGSTCNPIECYMASIVGLHLNTKTGGVYPSLTVDVGVLKIERNLRERRKMTKTVIETETETTERVVCGYRGCDKPAVAKGFFQENREFLLCMDHLAEAKQDRRNWSGLGVF